MFGKCGKMEIYGSKNGIREGEKKEDKIIN